VQCTNSRRSDDLLRHFAETRYGASKCGWQLFPADPAATGRTTYPLHLKPVGAYSWAMKQPIVSRSLEVMGGTAVFHGTRVPVQTLLDYLEAGESIDEFLEGFPSVTRERVIAFLQEAKDRVIEAAS
jgi:uncharacterized protein (DUF433 family)